VSEFRIGSVSGDGNVFGDHNHVLVTLRASADDLARAVAAHEGALREPGEAAAAAAELRTEAARAAPDGGRLQRLLARLLRGAGGVAAIAEAAGEFEHLVETMR
jgi:hypothetical protein